MKYEGNIYRPPSEADSLLIQVTVSCSHNRCTFCDAYKGVKFRIKSREEILEDILEAGRYSQKRRIEKIFLCDGDALIIPQKRLVEILELIGKNIHGVKRVGIFGNTKGILRKSVDELRQLKELGLGIVYLGVESGNDAILEATHKGTTYDKTVEAGRRIKEAGITLSAMVLLGLGGVENSVAHALDTARILTAIDPDYAGALTLLMIPGTPLYDDYQAGRFVVPDTFGFLQELGLIIANSNFTNCFFTSNHASNYLPIRARMPEQKEATVAAIRRVIAEADKKKLRPEYLRAF
jgi:radical SAM superfamily enzyme YgiQ (UPF0313 family)